MRLPHPRTWPYLLLRWLPLGPRLGWLVSWLTNERFLLSVSGLVRDDRGRLLLCHHTYRQRPWGLPGGWMQRGESPLAALEREVREETGLVVRASRLLLVGTAPDRPKHEFVVEAWLLGGEFRPSGEVDAIRWCEPADVPRLPASYRRALAAAERLGPGEVGCFVSPWDPALRRELAEAERPDVS